MMAFGNVIIAGLLMKSVLDIQATIFKYYGTAREKKQQFTVQLGDKEEKALQVAEIIFGRQK